MAGGEALRVSNRAIARRLYRRIDDRGEVEHADSRVRVVAAAVQHNAVLGDATGRVVATWHVRYMCELHWRQEVGTELLSYEGVPTHLQHLGYAVLLAPRGIVQDAPSSPADEHEVRAAAALDESG